MTNRIKYVCPECGGEEIDGSAYTRWDTAKQDWVIKAHETDSPLLCAACDAEFYPCEAEQPLED